MFSRAADNLASAVECLNDLAMLDLGSVDAEKNVYFGQPSVSLSISGLDGLSQSRKSNLLRYWLRINGFNTPDQAHLSRILNEVVTAREDAQPCVHWRDIEIRRFQGRLYAMMPLRPVPQQVLRWDIASQSKLNIEGSELNTTKDEQAGMDEQLLQQSSVEIRFRQGGERVKPAGDSHTRELKKLFQEAGIPPWIRERIPLIYVGGKLAAVPDLWVFEPFQCEPGTSGINVHWQLQVD
jgi:tRNA(Ile)-lysidine synthase